MSVVYTLSKYTEKALHSQCVIEGSFSVSGYMSYQLLLLTRFYKYCADGFGTLTHSSFIFIITLLMQFSSNVIYLHWRLSLSMHQICQPPKILDTNYRQKWPLLTQSACLLLFSGQNVYILLFSISLSSLVLLPACDPVNKIELLVKLQFSRKTF